MDIALNSSGDIDIENGLIRLTSGVDSIAQDMKSRLLFFLGEWFLDTRLGVDWFGKVLLKRPNQAIVHAMIRDVVTKTPGVGEITDFTFNFDAARRELNLEVAGRTEDLEGFTFTFSELLLPDYAELE
jgi:hypothetical protein